MDALSSKGDQWTLHGSIWIVMVDVWHILKVSFSLEESDDQRVDVNTGKIKGSFVYNSDD